MKPFNANITNSHDWNDVRFGSIAIEAFRTQARPMSAVAGKHNNPR